MLALAGCYIVVLGVSVYFIFALRGKELVSLENKVVLVTGASSGLGRASCFAFCRRKCRLILCSRRSEELMTLKKELITFAADECGFALEAEVLAIDISDVEAIAPALERVLPGFDSRVDVLINNAGISYRGSFMETDYNVYERIMKVNFLGQVALTKAVLPYMLANRGGHIVGVGSVQGKIAQPYRAPYAASKHACQAFYDSLRAELAHCHVCVSVINPGYVRTNLSVNALTGDGTTYGRVDASTSSGYEAADVASEIVGMVAKRTKEKMVAPLHHKMAVWIRNFFPPLYFWIMTRRAVKSSG